MIESNKILEVKNLRKVYDKLVAVDDVSFSIAPGEIVGLLGPNGAGKTTTIDIILGLLIPTSGSVTTFGKDFSSHRAETLEKMNFSAVYAQLPGNLTIWQNLIVFAFLYDIDKPSIRVRELIKEFDLEKYIKTKSGFLSSGEQSRLNLAKALLNNPKLILLDEPTASVDPSASETIRQRITAYVQKERAAVLWTSHNMREIEKVCSRVLFISHGKILLEGDPKKLPSQYGKKDLEELFISVAREPLTLHT